MSDQEHEDVDQTLDVKPPDNSADTLPSSTSNQQIDSSENNTKKRRGSLFIVDIQQEILDSSDEEEVVSDDVNIGVEDTNNQEKQIPKTKRSSVANNAPILDDVRELSDEPANILLHPALGSVVDSELEKIKRILYSEPSEDNRHKHTESEFTVRAGPSWDQSLGSDLGSVDWMTEARACHEPTEDPLYFNPGLRSPSTQVDYTVRKSPLWGNPNEPEPIDLLTWIRTMYGPDDAENRLPRTQSEFIMRAGAPWDQLGEDSPDLMASGRHHLGGDVSQASELARQGSGRQSRHRTRHENRSSYHRYTPYDEFNRVYAPEPNLIRQALITQLRQRIPAQTTHSSTFTDSVPTLPNPFNPVNPALIYPTITDYQYLPPLRHKTICNLLNPYFTPYTPRQRRPCSPPPLINTQRSPRHVIPISPPELVTRTLPHLTPSIQPHLTPSIQPHFNPYSHTSRPCNSSIYIRKRNRRLGGEKVIQPFIANLPLEPTRPFTSFIPISEPSPVRVCTRPTDTLVSSTPRTYTVTSNTINPVYVQSLSPSVDEPVASTYPVASMEINTSCSDHLLNRMSRQRQPIHRSHTPPDLPEHLQYQLWPVDDMLDTDYIEEVETSGCDTWFGILSPDSSTTVFDASQGPLSSSSDTNILEHPLSPATPFPCTTTTPSPENYKSKYERRSKDEK